MAPNWLHHNNLILQEKQIKICGNLTGLKPSQRKALLRLSKRRYPSLGGYTKTQAWELASLSAATGRQLGLLIDRKGYPNMVIIGSANMITIPELKRQREGLGRLRGLRLFHTHFEEPDLSKDDLLDLLFLRLDSISVLNIDHQGRPISLQWAHLMPPNPKNEQYSISKILPWDQVETDFGELVTSLEEEFERHFRATTQDEAKQEKAIMVHVSRLQKSQAQASLNELAELARSADLVPVASIIQSSKHPNPKCILGKGKLSELEILCLQNDANVLIFDCELSATQLRNLARATERRILDRTQLILDIFAQRAKSKAGKLQVELAQLDYTLPRLIGQNRALSRLTGGIGGRGPGETKLELDRRKIRKKQAKINAELKLIRKQRKLTRLRRKKARLPLISLVGYTNAGKSTLLNSLTASTVYVADKLFASLDPTNRRLRLPNEQEVILSDTVGFIDFLPKNLKQAFQATLEELEDADIMVHVADASHPELDKQINAVHNILSELGMEQTPKLLALNKWDLLTEKKQQIIRVRYPKAITISAIDTQTLHPLVLAITTSLPANPPWLG